MSECLDLPVKGVSPALWGVKVHWKWPVGSFWGNRLELQCLFADGQLDKEFIPWPCTGKLIGGLKAGERLKVRLRLVDKNGKSRNWRACDWLDGVSSTDASDYLNCIDGVIRNSFINDALIQDGTISNAKIGAAIVSGHLKSKSDDRLMKNAENLPDSKAFNLKDKACVFSGSVIASKTCLSDDMREAVIDAVCNSEVFQSLVAQLNTLSNERESDAVRLQRGIDQALSDTIRNALKPGGLLFNCGR